LIIISGNAMRFCLDTACIIVRLVQFYIINANAWQSLLLVLINILLGILDRIGPRMKQDVKMATESYSVAISAFEDRAKTALL
jgi:hypothetical protein